jgi:hypothetical protein
MHGDHAELTQGRPSAVDEHWASCRAHAYLRMICLHIGRDAIDVREQNTLIDEKHRLFGKIVHCWSFESSAHERNKCRRNVSFVRLNRIETNVCLSEIFADRAMEQLQLLFHHGDLRHEDVPSNRRSASLTTRTRFSSRNFSFTFTSSRCRSYCC